MTSKKTINVAIVSGILSENSFTKRSKTHSMIKVNNMSINIFWNKSKTPIYNQLLGRKVIILGSFCNSQRFDKNHQKYIPVLGIKVENMEVINDL